MIQQPHNQVSRSHEQDSRTLDALTGVPSNVNGRKVHGVRSRTQAAMRKLFAVAGFSAPVILAASTSLGACGLEEGGLLFPDDGSADAAQESTVFEAGNPDSEAQDADAQVLPDADADDGEAAADSSADAPADVVDAGPVAGLSNDADKNNCIHWLTEQLGTTLSYDADNHTCLSKPLGNIPVGSGQAIYFWSKDAPNMDKIGFSTAVAPKDYSTKCSTYSVPPNKAEMESEVFTSGYFSTSNTASLPNVVLTGGSCPNGSDFIINLAP